MSDGDVRTVRSFCRICTSVCGILVDVVGDDVVRVRGDSLRSAHGELTGLAKVDPTIRAGAVSVPHGHQSANVNRLTSKDALDPITGMALYSGIPVSLHPVAAHVS